MTTQEHRIDLVEAYALDALDASERADFEAHIETCTTCNQSATSARNTAQMLALVAQPAAPPLRCKRSVLDRIERDQFLRAPTPRRATRSAPWATWAALAAMLALMLTGGWALTMQQQLVQAQAQIATLQTKNAAQATEMAQMQNQTLQLASYGDVVTDGEEICQVKQSATKARCFARPGDNKAVMYLSGLPALEPGKVYQLWLANDSAQHGLTVFTPPHNWALIEFDPPAPFDQYTQIMVTVEDTGGATQPSPRTVLESSLY